MDSTCIAIIVILVILVGLSAWCSSTETAYSSVNKVRLKNKAEDGNPRAQNALDLLEKYDKVLSCILIGNNIVNQTDYVMKLSGSPPRRWPMIKQKPSVCVLPLLCEFAL